MAPASRGWRAKAKRRPIAAFGRAKLRRQSLHDRRQGGGGARRSRPDQQGEAAPTPGGPGRGQPGRPGGPAGIEPEAGVGLEAAERSPRERRRRRSTATAGAHEGADQRGQRRSRPSGLGQALAAGQPECRQRHDAGHRTGPGLADGDLADDHQPGRRRDQRSRPPGRWPGCRPRPGPRPGPHSAGSRLRSAPVRQRVELPPEVGDISSVDQRRPRLGGRDADGAFVEERHREHGDGVVVLSPAAGLRRSPTRVAVEAGTVGLGVEAVRRRLLLGDRHECGTRRPAAASAVSIHEVRSDELAGHVRVGLAPVHDLRPRRPPASPAKVMPFDRTRPLAVCGEVPPKKKVAATTDVDRRQRLDLSGQRDGPPPARSAVS